MIRTPARMTLAEATRRATLDLARELIQEQEAQLRAERTDDPIRDCAALDDARAPVQP